MIKKAFYLCLIWSGYYLVLKVNKTVDTFTVQLITSFLILLILKIPSTLKSNFINSGAIKFSRPILYRRFAIFIIWLISFFLIFSYSAWKNLEDWQAIRLVLALIPLVFLTQTHFGIYFFISFLLMLFVPLLMNAKYDKSVDIFANHIFLLLVSGSFHALIFNRFFTKVNITKNEN